MFEYTGPVVLTTPAGEDVDLDVELYQDAPRRWAGRGSAEAISAIRMAFDADQPCTITLPDGGAASVGITFLASSGEFTLRGTGAPPATSS